MGCHSPSECGGDDYDYDIDLDCLDEEEDEVGECELTNAEHVFLMSHPDNDPVTVDELAPIGTSVLFGGKSTRENLTNQLFSKFPYM